MENIALNNLPEACKLMSSDKRGTELLYADSI